MKTKIYCPFELEASWKAVLEDELEKPYIQELASYVAKERASGYEIYPPEDLVFNALKHTPYNEVKVLIVGQDPYHGPLQAHGLSFSVPEGVRPPPSLQNIFKELQDDLNIKPPTHGCLLSWADQGVMLLNATLTVRRGEPMSHHGRGWEIFTDAIVKALAERKDPAIFVLWGKSAQQKINHLDANHFKRHCILKASHPSPLSAHNGFFNCKHFSQINEQLRAWGKSPINWSIE